MTSDKPPEYIHSAIMPRLHYRSAPSKYDTTAEPWVTPCETCAGTDFDLEYHAASPYRLRRFCVPCREGRAPVSKLVCAFPECTRDKPGPGSTYCSSHQNQVHRYGPDGLRPLKPYRGKRGKQRAR